MVERETPKSSATSFLGMPRSIAASVFNLRSFEYAFMDPLLCRSATYANRCKAVKVWHQLDDRGHMQLVERYLREAGNWSDVHSVDRSPRRLFTDPLYAVVGRSTGPYSNDAHTRSAM